MIPLTPHSSPLTEKTKRRAVFLDRDGTINVEKDYLHKIEDFEFIPGAPEAIKSLKDAGFLVIVVSNQSGIARGYFDDFANTFLISRPLRHNAQEANDANPYHTY